tara:strand:- start:17 stop:547 length:531 start_codon:yes stop_codon:yes gene_type:complete
MDIADSPLALPVRNKIYKEIEASPGLHFREIQRRTDLATGSLQYHLGYLEKSHFVRTKRDGKFVRYFSVRGEQLESGEEVIALLRQDSIRKIVLHLMTGKRTNNERIAKKVGLSPSTTSWHLDKLVKADLVEKRRRGRKIFFYIKDKEKIAGLLIGYKKTFFDELVDNFAEVWEGI